MDANLLSKIDELKTAIDKIRPIKPEDERRIMDKFRLDWNYHSNAIEGNRLTYGETRAFLQEGLTAQGKPFKDHLDIKGHNEVITLLESYVRKNEILTEATIRELHKILLIEPYKVSALTTDGRTVQKTVKLGEYKTDPNFIQTAKGELRPVVSPHDTPAEMHKLMDWLKNELRSKKNHPVVVASLFHHEFTRIHPFDDGNGRMARILMNLILMQNGLLPVIIKTEKKEQYIAALVRADAGEYDDLINLIAQYEIDSEELFLKAARGEDVSDFDDVDKRLALLKQELSHIEAPLELNAANQQKLFETSFEPFFIRLIRKLSAFDELYSESRLHIGGVRTAVGAPHGSLGLNFAASGKEKEALVHSKEVFAPNMLIHRLDFTFFWEGFKKAGPNSFGYQLPISLFFEKFKYRLTCPITKTAIDKTYLYQQAMKEDEILEFLKLCSAACLENIETQLRKK